MKGLLFDVNLDGYRNPILRILQKLGLQTFFEESNIQFATFAECHLTAETSDRTVWYFCQEDGWVLLTDNRNHDADDSLQATLNDYWQLGCLPVITLGDKDRFASSHEYAFQFVAEMADMLFGIKFQGEIHEPRVYMPRKEVYPH